MRHIIIATHAHFAAGIAESIELLAGGQADVRTISAFVDGNDDVAAIADQMLAGYPTEDEVVVCTDLMGGSVNNTFMNIIQQREGVHLVTNVNLPALLTLVLTLEDEPDLAAALRTLVASDDVRPVYCNDLVAGAADDEDF